MTPSCRPFFLLAPLSFRMDHLTIFLVIERFHQEQLLLYDNLQGHKWIPIRQLKSNSLAWGFIFRRKDQPSYSFQPEQYKIIAPGELSKIAQPKDPKLSKPNQKSSLGINAKKYRFPMKIKETHTGEITEPFSNTNAPNQGSTNANSHTDSQPQEVMINQPHPPSTQELGSGNPSNQHGIPMAGPPPDSPLQRPLRQMMRFKVLTLRLMDKVMEVNRSHMDI